MAEEIVQEIFWTNSAKISFNKIVDYIRRKWTEREAERFVNSTEEMLSTLKRYPEMCVLQTKEKAFILGY